MKNVVGCASEKVVPYVFKSEDEPLNSIAARPLIAPRRIVGAEDDGCAVRLRANPLLSGQVVTGWPSAPAVVSASYHSCSPAVTGGVAEMSATAEAPPPPP